MFSGRPGTSLGPVKLETESVTLNIYKHLQRPARVARCARSLRAPYHVERRGDIAGTLPLSLTVLDQFLGILRRDGAILGRRGVVLRRLGAILGRNDRIF